VHTNQTRYVATDAHATVESFDFACRQFLSDRTGEILSNDLFRAATLAEACVEVIGGVAPVGSTYEARSLLAERQRALRLRQKTQSTLSNTLEKTYTTTRMSAQQRKMTIALREL
jgi:hypothetical protein